ncbi:MAG: conjugal transfer protein TraF [Candidatus Brocadiia bacterium]
MDTNKHAVLPNVLFIAVGIIGFFATQAWPQENFDDFEPENSSRSNRSPMPGYAAAADSWSGMRSLFNPSTPSLSDRTLQMGTFLDIGGGVERGTVDDIDRKIDTLIDDFEDLEERGEDIAAGFDPSDPPDDLEPWLNDLDAFVTEANQTVDEITDDGYFKVGGTVMLPLLPIAVSSDVIRGTLALSAGAFGESRLAMESSGDAISTDLQGIDSADVNDVYMDGDTPVIELNDSSLHYFEYTDNAGVALQGGEVTYLGLGFSAKLWGNETRRLHAGTTVNAYRAELTRAGVLLDEFVDEEDDRDLDKIYEDEFSYEKTSTEVGVDAGVLWVDNYYSLGGVIRNINEPSFDYPDTSDSEFYQQHPQALRGGDEWTMDRQSTVQAALHTLDRRWMLSGAIDLNNATDTTGDDYRWLSVQGSYEPENSWISPRIGYRRNMTGEELTYYSAGVSIGGNVHIDVARTAETTSLDGSDYPRGFQINLTMGYRF